MSNGFYPDADNKDIQWWIKNPPSRKRNVFTVQEIMRAFGVTRDGVWYWIRTGQLDRIGRGLVSRKSVDAFLATHPKYAVKVANVG